MYLTVLVSLLLMAWYMYSTNYQKSYIARWQCWCICYESEDAGNNLCDGSETQQLSNALFIAHKSYLIQINLHFICNRHLKFDNYSLWCLLIVSAIPLGLQKLRLCFFWFFFFVKVTELVVPVEMDQ